MKTLTCTMIILLNIVASLTSRAQLVFSKEAIQASTNQNFTPALQELAAMLQKNAQDEQALNYRANIYNRQGNFHSAIADVQSTLSVNPKNIEALLTGGLAQTGLKDYAKAIAYFDAALKLNPNLSQALFFRGRSHLAAGNNERAVSDLDGFIELQPRNWEARYIRSIPLTLMKRYDNALADLRLVVGNNKVDSPLGKAAAAAMEKLAALKNKKQQDDLMLQEVGDFYTIYRGLEVLEENAKPLMQAIDPLAKPAAYLGKADAMEKAAPYIDRIMQYLNLHQKTIDSFTTDEGEKARTRWSSAIQRWTVAKERNSPFDIANYRYSGRIFLNIAAYPAPAGYTDARKNNDRQAFEAHQRKDLKQLTENLQLIEQAMEHLAKISPRKYIESQNSYQKTHQVTLEMIETVKKARF